jgi:hypothetical protein
MAWCLMTGQSSLQEWKGVLQRSAHAFTAAASTLTEVTVLKFIFARSDLS